MLQEGDSLPVVAPSLLTGIPITSTSSRYSLGLDDWISCDPSFSPEPLPLTRKRRIEQREEAGLSSSPPPRSKKLSLAKKSSQ